MKWVISRMEKWKGWRKWNGFDAGALFWGITMVTTVIYTVLALSAARLDPTAAESIRAGDSETIPAMAEAFGEAGGSFARASFFLFIAIVGWKLSFGIFDALAAGQRRHDLLLHPRHPKWSMSRIYLTYVWIAVAAGTLVLTLVGIGVMGNEDGPGFILNMLAFLSTFVMGAYCLVLLVTNKKLLPGKLQPGLVSTGALILGAAIYLGGLFVSLAVFGALPD